MKKLFKGIAVAVMMLCSSAVFAKDFDWSKCWCNYGAGIKAGTFIVDGSAGFNSTVNYFISNTSGLTVFGVSPYVLPYFDATLDIAIPIWKLPLTWGGFCGFNIAGAKNSYVDCSGFYVSFGGQVKYHVMLPVEKLDVYAGVRMGATIGADRTKVTILNNVYYDATKSDASGLYFGGFIGAAYYVANWFGFTAELGAPEWAKFGVSIKIN